VLDALAGRGGAVSVGGIVFDVRRGVVDPADALQPWTPIPRDGWVARVDGAARMRFGDVATVRVGVKTTADEVFIRERWDDLACAPDAALVQPLFTHHVARRWRGNAPIRSILYPYDRCRARRAPIDLAQWPSTAAYFESHRARLERRRYVVEGGRHWWEIWVPQRPAAWAAPKIVFPDISAVPKFAFDTSGTIVNGDCYWLTVDDERLALLMIAIANSALGVAYYDAVCGNRLYAGRRRFITQYVERFPIPDPEQPIVDEIVATARLLTLAPTGAGVPALEAQIDRLVRASFGLDASCR
jgi:hypothetical protein